MKELTPHVTNKHNLVLEIKINKQPECLDYNETMY